MSKKIKLNPVVKKIQNLKAEAPRNWASTIAERTGFSYSYIIAIAAGTKGRDAALEVLKHLHDIVDERNREIKKLTA